MIKNKAITVIWVEKISYWVIWLAPIFYMGLLWVLGPVEPIILPDSSGYIEFNPIRSAGYPLILKFIALVFGGISMVPAVQVALFSFSSIFFGLSIRLLLGRSWPAALVVLGSLSNPYLIEYHNAILTDSLFFSLAMVFLALLLRFIRSGKLSILAWEGLIVGFMIAVRPVGLAWAPFFVFLLLLLWRKHGGTRYVLKAVAFVGVPLLVMLAAENLAYYSFHEARTTLMDRTLFAKGALLAGCDAPGCGRPLSENAKRINDFIESDLAEVREFFEGLDHGFLVMGFLPDYEQFLQYKYVSLFNERSGLGELTSKTMTSVGLKRILDNPIGYLKNSWYHYLHLWNWNPFSPPGRTRIVNGILQGDPPLLILKYHPIFSKAVKVNFKMSIARWVMQLLGGTTLLFAVGALALLWVPNVTPRLEAALHAGLIVHGYFLLVALANVALPRYVYPVWPYMIFSTGMAGLIGLDLFLAYWDRAKGA